MNVRARKRPHLCKNNFIPASTGTIPGHDKLDRYVVVLWGAHGAIKGNKMCIVGGDNAEGPRAERRS